MHAGCMQTAFPSLPRLNLNLVIDYLAGFLSEEGQCLEVVDMEGARGHGNNEFRVRMSALCIYIRM